MRVGADVCRLSDQIRTDSVNDFDRILWLTWPSRRETLPRKAPPGSIVHRSGGYLEVLLYRRFAITQYFALGTRSRNGLREIELSLEFRFRSKSTAVSLGLGPPEAGSCRHASGGDGGWWCGINEAE